MVVAVVMMQTDDIMRQILYSTRRHRRVFEYLRAENDVLYHGRSTVQLRDFEQHLIKIKRYFHELVRVLECHTAGVDSASLTTSERRKLRFIGSTGKIRSRHSTQLRVVIRNNLLLRRQARYLRRAARAIG